MFIDQAKIQVKAGDGGSGIVSLQKGKLHLKGIPDGGNGGSGGKIIFEVDEGLNTLQQYKYKPYFKAQNGSRGGSNRKNGKMGEDLILKMPAGTIVKDDEGNVLFDLTMKGQQFVVASGGIGGRGNASFTNAKYKAPRFAQKGEPGEDLSLQLELKVLADVGIIGFPNVGKSTLISVISKAKPKIADYPFTTITPNLGVVETLDNYTYVVADIPGLIEGAHKGKGLGDTFLKHVERAGILLHMIDSTSVDPVADYEALCNELSLYSEELAKRTRVVALNKIDQVRDDSKIETIKEYFEKKEIPFFAISAIKKEGLRPLVEYLGSEVKEHKQPLPEVEEVVYRIPENKRLNDFKIEKTGDVYLVKGKMLERLVRMTDLENEEAIKYLHKQFKKIELDEKLIRAGAEEGDIVEIAGEQFDFSPELTED
jgi:GTP-binding protein